MGSNKADSEIKTKSKSSRSESIFTMDDFFLFSNTGNFFIPRSKVVVPSKRNFENRDKTIGRPFQWPRHPGLRWSTNRSRSYCDHDESCHRKWPPTHKNKTNKIYKKIKIWIRSGITSGRMVLFRSKNFAHVVWHDFINIYRPWI